MKISLVFTIDRKNLISSNMSLHRFEKGKRARNLREIAKGTKCTYQFTYYSIEIYVYPPTRRRLDPPNTYPTIKHLVDGLTDAGFWKDDDSKYMESMTFRYGGLSNVKGSYQFEFVIKELSID